MKKKVALIFGGRSLESDISVITAMQVLNNADRSRYKIEPVFMYEGDFYMKGLGDISAFAEFDPEKHNKVILHGGSFCTAKRTVISKQFTPDAALICCHGGEGENGILQAMLDYNGIAYTSAGVLASAIGMDKAYSKNMFESMLLNTVPHEVILRDEWAADRDKILFHIESFMTYPLIVKPASQGSSIGIAVADCREELADALEVAAEFDSKILIEQKLTDFTEVNCAAFCDRGEIIVSETEQPVTLNDFLTFDDKYTDSGKMSGCGRRMPAEIGSLDVIVKANTERIYRELELNGVVRMDYLVDRTRNKVYINEINTVPGSMAYYLFEPLGISFAELISKVIENAELYKKRRECPHRYRTDILKSVRGGGGKIRSSKI